MNYAIEKYNWNYSKPTCCNCKLLRPCEIMPLLVACLCISKPIVCVFAVPQVLKAASPVLLRTVLLGAVLLYCPVSIKATPGYCTAHRATCALVKYLTNRRNCNIISGLIITSHWIYFYNCLLWLRSKANVNINHSFIL